MIAPPLMIYKISRFFYNHRMKIVGKFFSYLNRLCFKCWIPGTASIGKGTDVGYWGIGTIIHSNSVIGENCLIAQNVTIGKKLGDKGVPVLGNNVYVGTGSVVFGEITIGDNVIIGSNSVVCKDVPSNCTVVGNPMRIIKENRKETWKELHDK